MVWYPALLTNSLLMVSKAISTHGSQTSSPVAVNVWPKMEFSHSLFVSRLEFLKAAFWALFFFLVFINDLSDSLENPLYLFDSTHCHDISHPSDRQAATSSLDSDVAKIRNCSNTILLLYPYCLPFAFSLTLIITCIQCWINH